MRKEEETGLEKGRSGTTMVPPRNNGHNRAKQHENDATLCTVQYTNLSSCVKRRKHDSKEDEVGRRWCDLKTTSQTDQNITKMVHSLRNGLCTIRIFRHAQ